MDSFERFIEDSFAGEKLCRELRLSEEEIQHLRKLYPEVSVREINSDCSQEAKKWVEVKLCDVV